MMYGSWDMTCNRQNFQKMQKKKKKKKIFKKKKKKKKKKKLEISSFYTSVP